MKAFLTILKLILVIPMTIIVLLLINKGLAVVFIWYGSLTDISRWLLGSLAYIGCSLSLLILIGTLSWVFYVGNATTIIITSLIFLNALLWVYFVWDKAEIMQSIELEIPILITSVAICYIPEQVSEILRKK